MLENSYPARTDSVSSYDTAKEILRLGSIRKVKYEEKSCQQPWDDVIEPWRTTQNYPIAGNEDDKPSAVFPFSPHS